jgi:hypothetical protein
MEKARAKRRRREADKSRRRKAPSTEKAAGLTEKVIDLAQGAAAQVGAIIRRAADTITPAGENCAKQTTRHRSERGSSPERRRASRLDRLNAGK